MEYEIKVILTLLAENICRAKSVKEAYKCVARAANVEGVCLPTFEEMRAELEEDRKKD